jgi:hypothetical protein
MATHVSRNPTDLVVLAIVSTNPKVVALDRTIRVW